jgi:hypothetical protein
VTPDDRRESQSERQGRGGRKKAQGAKAARVQGFRRDAEKGGESAADEKADALPEQMTQISIARFKQQDKGTFHGASMPITEL